MNRITERFKAKFFYLEAVRWARSLSIGRRVSRGCEGLAWLAGVEEAGLDAAEGAEHPAMLAPDLPLELIPLAGNHMEDILQTWRARDIGINQRERNRVKRERERNRKKMRETFNPTVTLISDELNVTHTRKETSFKVCHPNIPTFLQTRLHVLHKQNLIIIFNVFMSASLQTSNSNWPFSWRFDCCHCWPLAVSRWWCRCRLRFYRLIQVVGGSKPPSLQWHLTYKHLQYHCINVFNAFQVLTVL